MMIARKAAVIVTVFALVLALTACGQDSTSESDSDTAPASTGEATNASGGESLDEVGGGFDLGTYDGNTYSNETLGLSLTIPDGFSFADADELVELNDMVGDDEASSAKSALEAGSTYICMYAQNDGKDNVNLSVLDMSAAGNAGHEPQDYRDASLPAVVKQLENMGLTIDERVTGTFTTDNGLEVPALKIISSKPDGTSICQEQVFLTSGNYLITFTATASGENMLDSLLLGLKQAEGGGTATVEAELEKASASTGGVKPVDVNAPSEESSE